MMIRCSRRLQWRHTMKSTIISFIIVSVLLLVDAQIICRIEVDSTLGLWRDVTPTPSPPNQAPNCVGYSYRETSLACNSTKCPTNATGNGDCTVYSNVDKQLTCLATCKGGCKHGYQCPKSPANCPCQKQVARYQTRMCVPHQKLQKCDTGQVNEKNECVPTSCIDACQNGRCDKAGACTCLSGFSLDQRTNACVPYECVKTCVNGICDVYGVCTCHKGFNKIAGNRCDKINCPDARNKDYCQSECQDSGCIRNNGRCEQGACKCEWGFTKNAEIYKCEAIRCPDPDATVYCKAECDRKCTNGRCSDEGNCVCNQGYKRDRNDKYVCNKIICPANFQEVDKYCKAQCDGRCTNGTCDRIGFCKCNTGFKVAPATTYQCNEIKCPSSESEDNEYCTTQCGNSCGNGSCDDSGHCECNEGFTKLANDRYMCGRINCRANTGKSDTELTFCKSLCEQQCKGGECDTSGFCNCSEGFKKNPGEDFNCVKIKCPTSKPEDKPYCKDRCSKTCTNGDCDERGACVCQDAFVPTNRTRVDCHHECHDDESCSLEAILGGIIGGGFAVVVAIIVIAALAIRNRNREERAKEEKAELPAMPLETLAEEPEYVNFGQ